jgi:tRNA G10  N-methylase Trm11
MNTFFILGSHPALSAAEILALLGQDGLVVPGASRHVLIVETPDDRPLDANSLMARLGGTVKIGTVIADDLPLDAETLTEAMAERLLAIPGTERRTFGISFYALGADTPERRARTAAANFKNVGMEVKGRLTAAGRSARWVKAQEGASLSSVAVEKNSLLTEGAEFCVFLHGERCQLGVTSVVQPFEEFSAADYGRPDRDTLQGMLPPKLARIMVNLAVGPQLSPDTKILDPFCGSGTVLSEALRLGVTSVIGSDRNPAAIEATENNIAWVREHHLASGSKAVSETMTSDAREIGGRLAPASIDAVITEPFLGEPRRGREKRGDIQRVLGELQRLYRDALANWRQALKPGAPVVIALPVHLFEEERHGTSVKEFAALGFMPEPLLPASVLARIGENETKNRGLIYGRPGQLVWREIVRLKYHI